MNASHEVEARARVFADEEDGFYGICPQCYNRVAWWLWERNAWRCEHCQRDVSDGRRDSRTEWRELPKTGTTRRAGLPVAYLESLVNDRRARGDRASASDDEDAYAELRAARVRAEVGGTPPGLGGPREFAVPAGQLAGLRYHVMVRGCV